MIPARLTPEQAAEIENLMSGPVAPPYEPQMPGGERRMTEPTPTHWDLARQIERLSDKVERLAETLGKPNEDGDSGTGFIGQMLRMQRDVSSLNNLKNRGVGFIAAIAFTSTLLLMGLAQWVHGVVEKFR